MSDAILSDKILSSSAFSQVIAVPIEKIDIADWLFNLPEAEYQRCCTPDHISCGVACTDDGIRMRRTRRKLLWISSPSME
jgi:hypothetical protein